MIAQGSSKNGNSVALDAHGRPHPRPRIPFALHALIEKFRAAKEAEKLRLPGAISRTGELAERVAVLAEELLRECEVIR